MKLHIVIIATTVVTNSLFAGIGENFEKGGIWIGGDGWIQLFDVEKSNSNTSLNVAANQKFYIVENLNFGFTESFTYIDFGTEKFQYGSVGASVGYSIVPKPEASQGAVHTIDFAVLNQFSDNASFNGTSLSPSYTFEYFVTERIAPYAKAAPFFMFSDEDKIFNLGFGVGLALHFPTKMRVNIHPE